MYIPEFDPEKSGRIVVGIDLIEIGSLIRIDAIFVDHDFRVVVLSGEIVDKGRTDDRDDQRDDSIPPEQADEQDRRVRTTDQWQLRRER